MSQNNMNATRSRNYTIGSGLLIFILLQHVIPTSLLFLNITMNKWYFPMAVVFSVGWIVWFTIKSDTGKRSQNLLVNISAFVGLIALSFLFVSQFIDSSFDGMFYHQPGTIYLTEGWNAVKTDLDIDPIVKHYPIGVYAVWGSVYSLFNKIELSKYVSVALMFASFLIVLDVYKSIGVKKKYLRLPLAAITACHPVFIYQAASFYLDGIVANVITIIIALFITFFRNHKQKEIPVLIILALSFLANLKFTAVGFAIILMGAYTLLFLITKNYRQFWRFAGYSIISLLLGIVISGYHPYVKNTKDYGHLFYPLNEVDLMNQQGSVSFEDHNRLVVLGMTLFSRSEGWIPYTSHTKWKLPFDTTDQPAFMGNDPRVGGFGSLFSGILVVSLILFILLVWKSKVRKWPLLYLLSVTFLSTLIVSALWWVRYIPQFFLLPVIVTAWACFEADKSKWIKGLAIFNLLLFVINGIMIANVNYTNANNVTRQAEEQLARIDNRPVKADFTCFASLAKRYEERGIPYEKAALKHSESIIIAGAQNMAKFVFHDTLFTTTHLQTEIVLNKEAMNSFKRNFQNFKYGESITLLGNINRGETINFIFKAGDQEVKKLDYKQNADSAVAFQRTFTLHEDFPDLSLEMSFSGSDTTKLSSFIIEVNRFKN